MVRRACVIKLPHAEETQTVDGRVAGVGRVGLVPGARCESWARAVTRQGRRGGAARQKENENCCGKETSRVGFFGAGVITGPGRL